MCVSVCVCVCVCMCVSVCVCMHECGRCLAAAGIKCEGRATCASQCEGRATCASQCEGHAIHPMVDLYHTESITVMGHTMTIASLVPQDYTHTMLLNSFTSPV